MSWTGIGKDLLGRLGDVSLPKLTRDAEIAVYMVHHSDGADDYFFLFDFEEFVEKSSQGAFVRPVLKVYAGRDDFSRVRFARQFREVFAQEFDRMRQELADSKAKRGWLDWQFSLSGVVGFVADLVLASALSVGRSVFGDISLPSFLKGKSDDAKLVAEIDATKTKVETALEQIDVTVHPELLEHAERQGYVGPRSHRDRDAWPLPEYVRSHLNGKKGGAWW